MAKSALELLEARRDGIAEYLREIDTDCLKAQQHLDEGTEARAYWHHGYYMAMRDVLALLGDSKAAKN